MGLGNRRCRSGDKLFETLRFGDRSERPHPSDRAESGRQHHLSYRAPHGLSATDRGHGTRPRASQGPERSAAQTAWHHQRQDGADAGDARFDGYTARLTSAPRISSKRKSSMIGNAVSRAFIVPLSAAVCMLALASDLQAAPPAPRSMSSLMHFDHAAE